MPRSSGVPRAAAGGVRAARLLRLPSFSCRPTAGGAAFIIANLLLMCLALFLVSDRQPQTHGHNAAAAEVASGRSDAADTTPFLTRVNLEEGEQEQEEEEGEHRPQRSTFVNLSTALGGCFGSFVAGSVVTVLFMSRQERALDAWKGAISSPTAAWWTGAAALVAWVLWLLLAFPVEMELLPKLSELCFTSYDFMGDVKEHDWDGDKIVSLLELQRSAQVPISAATLQQFQDSEMRWKAALNALQDGLRAQVNEIVDGDPVPVVFLLVHMLTSTVIFYGLLLAYVFHLAQDDEEHSLGVGSSMWAALTLHQLFTVWRVLTRSTTIAQNMERNVHMLRKVQQKLSSIGKDVTVYNLLDTVDEFTTGGATGKGKRWGVMLGGYRIDQHFTRAAGFNVGMVLFASVFLMPLLWLLKEHYRKDQITHSLNEEIKTEKKRRKRVESQKFSLQKQITAKDEALHEAERNKQLVSFEIHANDLRPWPEDQSKGYDSWRKLEQQSDGTSQPVGCFVNGKHLHGREKFSSEGAFGTVFRAMLSRPGSTNELRVAIKCLNVKTRQASFTDEVRLFQVLKHKNIVKCHGILTEKEDATAGGIDQHHIVTEFCSVSLDAFLLEDASWQYVETDDVDLEFSEQYLTQDMIDEKKCKILLDVARGMSFLHDLDVLHRDIKTQNILHDAAKVNWKICDFGEARVLKRPFMLFKPRAQWKSGYIDALIESGRIERVTSRALRDKGARYYCWILPGEEFNVSASAVQNGSTISWIPCVHGGFVYWFGELGQHDDRDCYFEVDRATERELPRQQTEAEAEVCAGSMFPQSLPPFGVLPISDALHPILNFGDRSWTLPEHLDEMQFPGLRQLRSLKIEVSGHISPAHTITLNSRDREIARIPPLATHFCWAYRGLHHIHDVGGADGSTGVNDGLDDAVDHLTAEDDTGVMAFLSVGGFVYFQCLDQDGKPDLNKDLDPARVAHVNVCGVNSIGLGLGPRCNIGTIKRTDQNVTARIASPELLEGIGIGLPTDVYAFGILIWEIMTRQVAWNGCGDSRIQHLVGNEKHRPKMPAGLMPEICDLIRYCLHANPAHRPTAEKLSAKIYALFNDFVYKPNGRQSLPKEPTPRTVQVRPDMIRDRLPFIVPGIMDCDSDDRYCKFTLRHEQGKSRRCRDLLHVDIDMSEESNHEFHMEEAQTWFHQTDVNGDGILDRDELRQLLKSSGSFITEEELQAEFSRIDSNGDGQIDEREFCDWFVIRRRNVSSDIIDSSIGDSVLRRQLTRHVITSDSPREQNLWFSCYVKRGWLVSDEHGRQWNTLGKFIGNFGEDPMTQNSEPALLTDAGWEALEDAAMGAPELEDLGTFETTIEQPGKLGIAFRVGKVDWWPVVQKIDTVDKTGTQATLMSKPEFLNIRKGCELLTVNGKTVRGKTFGQIKPELADDKRPVRLLWSERIESHFGSDTKDKQLGLLFGQAGNKFPLCTKVKENSLCDGRRGLMTGCILHRIKSEKADRLTSNGMDFRTAVKLMQKRPLTLVFKAAPRNRIGHELQQDFLQNRFQILSPMTNEPEPEEEASVNIPEGTPPPPSTPRRSCLAAAGPKVAEGGQDFSLGKTSSHTTSEGGRSTGSDTV